MIGAPHVMVELDLLSTVQAIQYKDRVLQSGPMSYHRMQATSGTSETDASGNGRTGTYTAAPPAYNQTSPITGEPTDRAIKFSDGAAGAVALGFTGALPSTGELTVECWINDTKTFAGPVPEKRIWTAQGGINYTGIVLANTYIRAYGSGIGADYFVTLTANTWYYLAVTFTANEVRIYLNGSMVSSQKTATTNITSPVDRMGTTWRWGAGDLAGTVGGAVSLLDEGAIYGYALSDSDVADHYAARTTAAASAPIWWNINEHVRESISISEGRSDTFQQPEPAVLNVTLDNRYRQFEGAYTGALINLTTNPSFELNTTGWTSSSTGGAAPTLSRAQHSMAGTSQGLGAWVANLTGGATGIWSLIPNVINSTLASSPSGYYAYVRARVRWTGGTAPSALAVNVRQANNTTGAFIADLTPTVGVASVGSPVQNTWYELYGWVLVPASGPYQVGPIVQAVGCASSTVLQVDGVHLLIMSAPNTDGTPVPYYDGDRPNARWAGTAHASQSYLGGEFYGIATPRRKIRVRCYTGGNMVNNGSFEETSTNWTATGTVNFNSDSTDFWHRRGDRGKSSGSTGYRAFSPATVGNSSLLSNEYMRFNPRQAYTLSAAMRTWSGTNSGQNHIRLLAYNKQGTQVGFYYPDVAPDNATESQVNLRTGAFAAAASFTRYGGTFSAGRLPADTYFVRVEIYLADAAVSQAGVIVDAVELVPGCDATLLIDGPQGYDEGRQYMLFTGYIEDFKQGAYDYNRSTVSVEAHDYLAILNETPLRGRYFPQQKIEARLASILNAGGVPTANRSLETAINTVQAEESLEDSIAGHAQLIAEAEWGLFYVDRNEICRFYYGNHSSTARGTLTDVYTPSATMLKSVETDSGESLIINEWKITREGGVEQIASNPDSQRLYGVRSRSEQLPLESDTTCRNRATDKIAWLATPHYRITGASLEPYNSSHAFDQVLPAEFDDSFTLTWTPAGFGSPQTTTVYLQSRKQTIPVGNESAWQIDLGLST